jgi:hypothetical protein
MTLFQYQRPSNRGKYKISEETRRKISENNARYWLGKTFSEEHRKNISLAKKGKPSWIKGKHHSEVSKKKMSLSQKGKPKPWLRGLTRSAGTLRRMSIAQKGRHSWQLNGIPLKEEHRKKISISNMGKPAPNKGIKHSSATIKKISIAMLRWWSSRRKILG